MHATAWLVFILLTTLTGAQAHPILQNPVWIESSPERLTLKLDVSVRELVVVQGLTQAGDGGVDIAEATERADRHSGYLLDHFHCKADGKLLAGKVMEIKPPKEIIAAPEGPDNAHFRYTIFYPLSAPPAVLTFSQNMCVEFPSAPGVPWDLSYAYRYGREGETPVKFGAMVRDREISFSSGFAPASTSGMPPASAGSATPGAPAKWEAFAITDIKTARPAVWLALWLLFVSAMTLGGPVRLLWYQLAAALWFGSYLAAPHLTGHLPLWLLALLTGAVTILAAVDNIHASAASGPARHRIILLLTGAVLCGSALGLHQPGLMASTRGWMALLLVCAVAAAAIMIGLRVVARSGRRPCTQLASLACCGGAIFSMLRLLEVV